MPVFVLYVKAELENVACLRPTSTSYCISVRGCQVAMLLLHAVLCMACMLRGIVVACMGMVCMSAWAGVRRRRWPHLSTSHIICF